MGLFDLPDTANGNWNTSEYTEEIRWYLDESEKETIRKSFLLRKQLMLKAAGITLLTLLWIWILGMISDISGSMYESLIIGTLLLLSMGIFPLWTLYYIFIWRLEKELSKWEKITIKATIKRINLQKLMSSIQVNHQKYSYATFIFANEPAEPYAMWEKISLTFLPKSATILSIKKL
jgi:hypothetical protein